MGCITVELGRHKVGLRISLQYGQSGSGGSDMTDWIDLVAQRLTTDEQVDNERRAHRLLHHEIIKARAPEFCSNLGTHIEEIAKELDQKLGGTLGGVVSMNQGNGFMISNQGHRRMTVKGHLNPKGEQIDI